MNIYYCFIVYVEKSRINTASEFLEHISYYIMCDVTKKKTKRKKVCLTYVEIYSSSTGKIDKPASN
jgi:hypothetical protein